MPTPTSVRAEVRALLEAVPNLNFFDGHVDDDPPLDPDGRVHPYAVLWSSPGHASSDALTPDRHDQIKLGPQVTCVGGDVDRCLWAVERVRDALTGAALTGGASLREDFLPSTVSIDRDVRPHRFYVPVLYALITTR